MILNTRCCFYRAIREAKKSDFHAYKLGALVLNKCRIISKGFNSNKGHGRMIRDHGYRGGKHAECDAIMRASSGDTLVVVRIRKDGKLSCSKPCEKCLKLAKEFGIKKIIYTDWDSSVCEMRI